MTHTKTTVVQVKYIFFPFIQRLLKSHKRERMNSFIVEANNSPTQQIAQTTSF